MLHTTKVTNFKQPVSSKYFARVKSERKRRGDATTDLQLGRAEMQSSLRKFPSMDRPEHNDADRLKERVVEKRSGRRSILRGKK